MTNMQEYELTSFKNVHLHLKCSKQKSFFHNKVCDDFKNIKPI